MLIGLGFCQRCVCTVGFIAASSCAVAQPPSNRRPDRRRRLDTHHHDFAGILSPRNNDPRFARFNRWRSGGVRGGVGSWQLRSLLHIHTHKSKSPNLSLKTTRPFQLFQRSSPSFEISCRSGPTR